MTHKTTAVADGAAAANFGLSVNQYRQQISGEIFSTPVRTLLKPTLPRPTTYGPARRWREYIRQQLGGTYPSPVPSVFLDGITDTLAVYVTHPDALKDDAGIVDAVCQIAATYERLPVIIVLIEHSTDSLTDLGDVHRECFLRGCWLQPYNCFE